MKKMILVLLVAAALTLTPGACFAQAGITVEINSDPYTAGSLEQAVEFSGLELDAITSLEFTGGEVTAADWEYIKDKRGNLTALKSLTAGPGVTLAADLPEDFLNGNTSIESVSIAGAVGFGARAFAGCGALERLTLPALPPTVDNGAFDGCPSPRSLTLVGEDGKALTQNALNDAIDAYKADGGYADGKWHGWTLPARDSSVTFKITNSIPLIVDKLEDADATIKIIAEMSNAVSFYFISGVVEAEDWKYLGSIKSTVEFIWNLTGLTVENGAKAADLPDGFLVYNTSIKSVDMANVAGVGMAAFANCTSLETASFPNAVSIGVEAFKDCTALVRLMLPASPPDVESGAFNNCPETRNLILIDGNGDELTGAALNDAIDAYKADEGYADGKWYGWTLPGQYYPITVKINNSEPQGGESLADAIDNSGVALGNITSIEITSGEVTASDWDYIKGNKAQLNSLAGLAVENGVTSAANLPEDFLSGHTSLTSVYIAKAGGIGESAFAGCDKLASLTLPASPPSVGSGAFDGCPSPRNLILVDENGDALTGTALNSALDDYDPNGTGQWEGWTLPARYANVTIKINGGTEYTGDSLADAVAASGLEHSQITSIDFTAGVVDTEDWDYITANIAQQQPPALERLTVAKRCTAADVPDSMLYYVDSLKGVDLASVKNVGKWAFCNSESLESAALPNALSIGDYAFSGCDALASLTLSASPPTVGSGAFDGCPASRSLTLADEAGVELAGEKLNDALDAYAAHVGYANEKWYGWTLPARYYSITVKTNGSAPHGGMSLADAIAKSNVALGAITSIEITAGAVAASDWDYIASNNASLAALKSLTVARGVSAAYLPNDFLKEHRIIERVYMPGVQYIGGSAFMMCKKLAQAYFPDAAYIDSTAFYECALTSLTLSATPPDVATSSFDYCPELRRLELVDASGNELAGEALTDALALYDPDGDGLWEGWTLPARGNRVTVRINNGSSVYTSASLEAAINTSGIAVNRIRQLSISGEVRASDILYIKANNSSLEFLANLTISGGAAVNLPESFLEERTSISGVAITNAAEIGRSAFYRCAALETASFPKATKIGASAFNNCGALSSLGLPATPPDVGADAFKNCPDDRNLVLIDGNGNALTGAALEGAIIAYESDAGFSEGKWRGWTLPASDYRITVEINGVGYRLDSLQDAIAQSGKALGEITSIEITAGEVAAADWDYIANNKASLTALESLTAARGVSAADLPDDFLKEHNSIERVYLPGVKNVGGSAFMMCKKLAEAGFPDAIYIDSTAFYECALTSLTLSATPPDVATSSFDYCPELRHIKLVDASGNELAGDDLTRALALYDPDENGLWEGWTLPARGNRVTVNIKGPGEYAGAHPSLEAAVKASGMAVNRIRELSISGEVRASDILYIKANKSSLERLENLTISGGAALNMPEGFLEGHTWIRGATMTNAVKIGSSAFRGCTALEAASFPKATEIGASAFRNCGVLSSLTLPASPPTVGSDAFNGCPDTRSLTLADENGNALTGTALNGAISAYESSSGYGGGKWYGWTLPARQTLPVFTTNPQSQVVNVGGEVTFTVSATGNPAPEYQWMKDGVDIPGATNATYTINPAALGDAGSYTCAAKNAMGRVVSGAGVLTVNPAYSIVFTAQPAPLTTVARGSITESLSAKAEVAPSGTATLNWYACDENGVITSASLGTGGTFAIPAALTEGTYYYICQASFTGAWAVNSSVARVVVSPAPVGPDPVITFITQPEALTTVTQGSIAGSLKASASVWPGGEAALNWYACDAGGVISSKALGTGETFTIPVGLEAGTYYYICQAAYPGALAVNSSVARVVVSPDPGLGILIPEYLIVGKGQRTNLMNLLPWNYAGGVEWESEENKVLKIIKSKKKRFMKAVEAGETKLTAKFANGEARTISVKVVPPKEAVSSVKGKGEIKLKRGQSRQMELSAKPDTATDKKLFWHSSDENIATVKDGNITAKKTGTCRVVAVSTSGKRKVIKVTVTKYAQIESVSLTPEKLTLKKGDTYKLTAAVLPQDANQTLKWSSKNPKIASVSKGEVTAKKAGTAVITCRFANGKRLTCEVTVE